MTWPDTMSRSGPLLDQGTSWSYMMYMVRGNGGGAETDGRAEDPFEAAACGASASALELLLLPLASIENLRTMLGRLKELRASPWRHLKRPSNPFGA